MTSEEIAEMRKGWLRATSTGRTKFKEYLFRCAICKELVHSKDESRKQGTCEICYDHAQAHAVYDEDML